MVLTGTMIISLYAMQARLPKKIIQSFLLVGRIKVGLEKKFVYMRERVHRSAL